ncbi:MAG: ABC transporter substrate-binding protein [Armatimonadota bacterium]|nr:ABC transporter substrate-binding protein [Armatimonadota bacterium]MDR7464727.1 ABC transporter substrate-binding protein [Armatimonadota bacterium]MDR7469789.1 ABC transporter substrate-binding protein [Armatimonadota bacterium]MDR7474688.1 ABC transporter substrate-binding protein [Armatimonadota bacterium]
MRRLGWVSRVATVLTLLMMAHLPVSGGAAVHQVRIAVGPPNVLGYLPLYMAKGLGYFTDLERKRNIKVDLVDFRGGSEAATALIGGDVDFATVTLTHVIKAHEAGKDLKFLLTFFNAQTMAMIVQADLDVTSPAQLRGRRIGITSLGSATHMQARHILAAHQVDPDAVQYVPVGGPPTALAAWQRKAVDAMVYLDPLITTLVDGRMARLIYDVRTLEGTVRLYGAPHISSGLLTRPEVIARDPETVQQVVGAFVCTLRWLRIQRTRPEEIARNLPAGLDWSPAVIRANLGGLSADGRVLPDAVQTVISFLKRDGLLVAGFAVPLDRLVNDTFVRRAILSGGCP